MKAFAAFWFFVALYAGRPTFLADGALIKEIAVEGNGEVESSAIFELMTSKEGQSVDPEKIRDDILALYGINYFSDVRIFKEPIASGIRLVVQVTEKPAITSIKYRGMDQITEDDIKDALETKLYTIVNEGTISTDMALIEKKYIEKGLLPNKGDLYLREKGVRMKLS